MKQGTRLWIGFAFLLACINVAAQAADDRAVQKDRKGSVSAEAERINAEIETLQAELDSLLAIVDASKGRVLPRDLLDEVAGAERRLEDAIDRLDAAVAAAPPPAAPAPPGDRGPRRRKPLSNTILKVGEDLRVGRAERVLGDAIVFAGDLRIEGEVTGDAIVVGGDLEIGRGARIVGQAIAVGGRVESSAGAQVGDTVAFSLLPRLQTIQQGMPAGWALATDVAILGLILLVAGGVLAAAPRRFERVAAQIDAAWAPCLGVGVLALTGGSFAVLVATLLLAMTFIGLPVAVITGAALGLVLLAGAVAGIAAAGRLAPGGSGSAPATRLALGAAVLAAPWLLGDLTALLWPPMHLWLALLSVALLATTTAAGLGALVLTRFGVTPAVAPLLATDSAAVP